MRFQSSLLAALSLSLLVGATPAEDTAIAKHIPECAMPCLADALQNSTCSPTDLSCVCDVAWKNPVLDGCAAVSCNIAESLAAINGTATACNIPVTPQTSALYISTTIICTLAIASALVRLFRPPGARSGSRWLHRADDWMMIGNVIFLIGMIVCTALIHRNGYGKDIWSLPTKQIRRIMILMYNLELQYTAIIHLTKLSILYFYLQFFPFTVFPALRTTIYATMAATLASGIGFTTTVVLQCTPVHSFWDAFNEAIPASERTNWRCMDHRIFGFVGASINLAFDVWLMFLPMAELLKLSLPLRKKIAVCLMFTVGGFVTVVTIPRVVYMENFQHTTNPTHDLLWVSFWAHLECTSSVILACTPSICIVLARLYRKHARPKAIFGHHPHHPHHHASPALEAGNELRDISSSTQLTKSTVVADTDATYVEESRSAVCYTPGSVPGSEKRVVEQSGG